MHDDLRVELGHDELQTLDNVLADAAVDGRTRRWVLQRAGAGLVAAGAFGAFGPVSSALAAGKRRSEGESPEVTLNTAVTAEAFAILFLNQAILRAPNTYTSAVPLKLQILQAAGAAEFDHYTALIKLGAKPLTTHVWIPDALFGDDGPQLFRNIEVAETLFVNAYLIAITNFAGASKGDNARYAAEIMGTEAEHRVLARAGYQFPNGLQHVYNDLGFEQYLFHNLSDIVGQLESLGIGFGTQGSAPGQFYDYDGTKPATFSSIDSNDPS